jgi:hypothetical protein
MVIIYPGRITVIGETKTEGQKSRVTVHFKDTPYCIFTTEQNKSIRIYAKKICTDTNIGLL